MAIAAANPFFLEPAGFLGFLKRVAPLAILAAGQYFVIVSGEFDLSVGSLVTVEVVVAARLIDGDEAMTWPVLALLIVIGLLVGLVNGLVTTRLRVPSFITTLGAMLILSGAVFLWTGGARAAALSQRVPGLRPRGRVGGHDPARRRDGGRAAHAGRLRADPHRRRRQREGRAAQRASGSTGRGSSRS